MSEVSLGELERDVENARAQLSRDLSVLRSPATMSAFRDELKHEAIHAKEKVVRSLQLSARSTALDFVEHLKAKAAANPAAVLIIGAGLAWRLMRNPPIASVLVGAGLFSLLRSTPIRSEGPGGVDFMAEAKKNLREQATNVVEGLKEHGTAVAADVTEQAREFTQEAMQKAHGWSAAAKDQVRKAAAFGDRVSSAPFDAEPSPHYPAESMEPAGNQEMKDALLLGAAGVAVVLALGLSYRRRQVEN